MDNYTCVELIGKGSFGKVYKARIKGSGHVVAMKFIPKSGKNEKELRSLRREIDILTKLNHGHIVTLFDAFETSGEFVVVMEYAQGELYEILEDDKHLPEDVVQRIAKQLIEALHYLHSNRIIHRDMKPQNILIGHNGVVKLADFGFARAMSCDTMVLTSIKGTPLYMAPELVQEQPYNNTADLWSLGCILYELYYGRPPFYTNNLYSLIHQIINDPVKFDEPISPAFKSFLSGLLTKSYTARLNWPELLSHPFVVASDDDARWLASVRQYNVRMKQRMRQLECFAQRGMTTATGSGGASGSSSSSMGIHAGATARGRLGSLHARSAAASGTAAATAAAGGSAAAVSTLTHTHDDHVAAAAAHTLTHGDAVQQCSCLRRLLDKMTETVSRAGHNLAAYTKLESVLHADLCAAVLTCVSRTIPTTTTAAAASTSEVLRLALQLLCLLAYPEYGAVLPFPAKYPTANAVAVLQARYDAGPLDVLLRQQIALDLMRTPHHALDCIVAEAIANTHGCRDLCLRLLYQCVRWQSEFGAMLTQLPDFPALWLVLLDATRLRTHDDTNTSASVLSTTATTTRTAAAAAVVPRTTTATGAVTPLQQSPLLPLSSSSVSFPTTTPPSLGGATAATTTAAAVTACGDGTAHVTATTASRQRCAFALYAVALLIPHIKLAAPQHLEAATLRRVVGASCLVVVCDYGATALQQADDDDDDDVDKNNNNVDNEEEEDTDDSDVDTNHHHDHDDNSGHDRNTDTRPRHAAAATAAVDTIATINHVAAAVLVLASLHREVADASVLTDVSRDGAAVLAGVYALATAVARQRERPVLPRALGSSYGYAEHGLLDGVVHLLYQLVVHASWAPLLEQGIGYGSVVAGATMTGGSSSSGSGGGGCVGSGRRSRRRRVTPLFDFVVQLISENGGPLELSPSAVQTALRLLHVYVLQHARQAVHLLTATTHRRGEDALSLLALLCRHLDTDYLQQLYYWPEARGGGSGGVSGHVAAVAQFLTEALKVLESKSSSGGGGGDGSSISNSSNSHHNNNATTATAATNVAAMGGNSNSSAAAEAERAARLHDAQQTLHREALMQRLVHALDYTEMAFWGTLFAVMVRLTNSSMYFVRQFCDCGGLDARRIASALEPHKANTSLIADALSILSQMARTSKEYYARIHEADLYTTLASLLRYTDKDVRGKTCTLIGNLCKHSAFFYEQLAAHDIVSGLVACCNDKELTTQKAAAFAVGNAAFHNDCLYDELKPAIPAMVKLLESTDDKTRQNAAGALCNFVRNDGRLADKLLEYHAPEALLRVLRTDTLALKKVAVITINSFCMYESLYSSLLAHGLKPVMQQLLLDPVARSDATIEKYAARIQKSIGGY